MSTPNSIITLQTINQSNATFANADGTNAKTLFTAAAGGSVIRGISGQTTDTSPNNVVLSIFDGANTIPIGTCRVAAGAGNDGATPSKDLLNITDLPFLKLDNLGNAILTLKAGYILKANVLGAVTAGKTLSLFAFGADF